jgi:YHS domain-containing protein
MAPVTDPVCGMQLEPSQAEAQTVYDGRAYYFCSEECRRAFEENPEEFIGDEG